MTAIVANTGSNNWNTGGAWVGGVQPTAADDVTIPASAVVTIPSATTVQCRSLTVAASGTVAWAATTSVLNIGDSTAGLGNVALSVSTSATITITGAGNLNFISTSSTTQTIDTGTKTLPIVSFTGAGSSYLLSSAFTSTSALTIAAGTWDTGNNAVTAGSFVVTGSTSRTLALGSSVMSFSLGTSNAVNATNVTSLSFSPANTATITGTGNGAGFTLGTADWNGASFTIGTGNCTIAGVPVNIKNLTISGGASKTGFTTIASSFTITGTFTATGNSLTNRVLVSSAALGTVTTITAATSNSNSNADFKDFTGAGAGSPFTGISIGDCGGNSGITFTTPVTRYAVVAGNVSSTAMWSTTSGGAGGSSVPLPQDIVNFGGGSAAGTYTNDMPRWGTNVDFTQNGGFTRTFALSLNLETYGSWTFNSSASMTLSGNSGIQFGTRTSSTFTSGGNSIGTAGILLQGPGGTITLQDALSMTGPVLQTDGTFNSNGFTVTCTTFSSTGTRTRVLSPGTSTMNVTASSSVVWNIIATGLTPTFGNSTIVISTTSASTRTFTGGAFNYGTLTYTVAGSTGQLNMSSAQFVDTYNFSDSTNARTITFTAGVVFACRVFNVFGTSGKLMTVKSVTGASATFLELIGAVNTGMDYLSIQDISSTIPDKFYAGVNSTSVSGNTNVNIAAAPTPGPYIDWLDTGTASGASVTTNISSWHTPVNGKTLVARYGSSGSATVINTPSGWSSNASTTQQKDLTKVSDGTETSLTVTTSGSPAVANLYIMQLGGYTGTPTYDVSDTNSSAAATSLSTTATTGPSNTGTPALALAFYTASGTMGASVSTTGSYEIAREIIGTFRLMAKTLTTTAAVSTTYTWSTSRSVTAMMVVYKDVVVAASSTGATLTMMGVG